MSLKAIPDGESMTARLRCIVLYLALIVSLIGATLHGDRGVFGSGPQLAAATEALSAVMPSLPKLPLAEPQSEPRPKDLALLSEAKAGVVPPVAYIFVVPAAALRAMGPRHAVKPESQAPPTPT